MLVLLRLWLRFLSAVAPRSAARVGARMWFRVHRPTISPESRAFLETGERFETRTKDSRVVGWRWGSGPTVLLMHGWGGYGAQLQPFVEPLVRAGHRVIMFDAPSLLVIHDRNDRETSWQDGVDIAASWPNAKLETTTGLGHNRILRDANVVASATAFIGAG